MTSSPWGARGPRRWSAPTRCSSSWGCRTWPTDRSSASASVRADSSRWPALVLLDEPSSGLDRSETAALAETLGEIQAEQGFAVLLVEHDIELVSTFTTRSYLLDFGRLLTSGPTAEVMSSAEMRAAYLGTAAVP